MLADPVTGSGCSADNLATTDLPSLEYSTREEETFTTSAGLVEPVEEESAEVDFLGEVTTGNLHLVERVNSEGIVNVLGLSQLNDIFDMPYTKLKAAQKAILDDMGVPQSYPSGLPHRAIFCSRTLNLRSIQAIGYDMDYTLIHYDVNAWEGKAYEYGLQYLREVGCPVEGLRFDPALVIRGLIVDQELGNLVKVDRFGYVKRAMHGTRMLSWSELRETYGRELVNLRNESRWVFLNTLFSVSEAVMYMQMVERMDQGAIPQQVVQNSYTALYKLVARALFRTHVEGKLKADIIQEPERYVELDPDMAQTLLDQREAGKVLILITNSDHQYTAKMMSFAYDRFMPAGKMWRDLFDMVIVQARKPDFFNYNMSLYEIVTDDGLMRPAMVAKKGGLYCGGSAKMVEKALGVERDDILYVGDHIYTDAALSKIYFGWRTALIVRELEQEIEALAEGQPHRSKLKELMNKKELVGDLFNQLRLSRQRYLNDRPPLAPMQDGDAVNHTLAQLLMVMESLDSKIGPMLEADGSYFSVRWGYLSRAGLNDKSQFTRQIEKYADIYTSRVSNFLRYTPHMYFRSPSQSLAHDRYLSDYYRRKYGTGPSDDAESSDGGERLPLKSSDLFG
ncbi:hypothetical protein WJX72_002959 [[Myrmecia] bisecta]|uniref:5'-nucleotidase n=1 Tax=[Myrmecia] bisecta TaxID=41462 RepID=A0AAW1QEJ9_9CHLO